MQPWYNYINCSQAKLPKPAAMQDMNENTPLPVEAMASSASCSQVPSAHMTALRLRILHKQEGMKDSSE
jgi:hypothetical protein